MGGQNWMDVFINWFPMVLLIGVWVFFLRRMRGPYTKYRKESYEVACRQAEALERIAALLERKI